MKAAVVADYVAMARTAMCDPECTCDHSIIRAVADERDAALSALRDEEKKTYAAMRETHDARSHRDRALALLVDWQSEGWSKELHQKTGALLAEVDAP